MPIADLLPRPVGRKWRGAMVLVALASLGSEVKADPAVETSPSHATVLLYHKFDEPEYPTTNISVARFREQLAYLRDHDYRVLDMATFRRHLERGEPFPARSVVITIDDPYLSVYEHAWPVLREFGYPFALFAWTKGLEGEYTALMGWSRLEEMAKSGVTIGNHTHTHPYLAVPGAGESQEAYARRVSGEITTAQNLLRKHGIESDLLAYPYGEYNRVVLAEAAEAGYRLMFTQDPGAVGVSTPLDRIPRIAIVGENNDVENLITKLDIIPLAVGDVRPPFGFLSENPPEVLSLRILDPADYDRGVVNMFVSEWGRVDAEYDPRTGIIRFAPGKPLSRATNRLIVTAKEIRTGRFAYYAQMLVRPFEELSARSSP